MINENDIVTIHHLKQLAEITALKFSSIGVLDVITGIDCGEITIGNNIPEESSSGNNNEIDPTNNDNENTDSTGNDNENNNPTGNNNENTPIYRYGYRINKNESDPYASRVSL